MQNVNRQLAKTGKQLQGLGTNFSLGLTAPLAGLGAIAISVASDMETLKTSLDTVFKGDQELSTKAFEDIKEFSSTTPFQLKEVATAFIKLKNLGLDPSIQSLTSYGNTASALGKDLDQMIEAVADASVGEFERLKEFGIKAKSQGDQVSFTFQGVTQTVGKNSEDIQKYLLNIGNVNFAGSIDRQANTFKGKISTLKDNIEQAAASIGEILIDFISPFFEVINKGIRSFQELSPEIKKFIVVLGLLLAAIGPVVVLIGTFIRNLAVIIPLLKTFSIALAANPVVAFAIAIGVVGSALIATTSRFRSLTNAEKEFANINNVATQSIAEQKAEMQRYLVTAKDDTLSKAEREKAIKKLNALSPEYLGGLKLETINTDKATTATDKYVNALLVKAKVQAAQEKLVSVQKQLLDLQLGQNDALKPSVWQVVKNQVTSFGNAHVAAAKNARSLVENFVEEKTELGKLEEKLIDFINQNDNLAQSVKDTTTNFEDLNKQINGVGRAKEVALPKLNTTGIVQTDTPITAILKKLPKELALVDQEFINFQLSLLEFEAQSGNILESAAETFAVGFGNIIAGIAQGANPIQGLVTLILGTIGDMLQQLGKAAISIGITMTGIKKAFASPFAAIAAGVAAIALGAIIKSFIPDSFAGSFANGGVVGGNSFTGDKLFARINSGEMVLNQKQQANLSGMLAGSGTATDINLGGGFELRGETLKLLLKRTDQKDSRRS